MKRAVGTAVVLVMICALSPAVGQAASPAWKLLAATGPTNLPPKQSEVQRITVEAEGGTFRVAPKLGEGKGTPVSTNGLLTVEKNNTKATAVNGTYEVGDRVTAPGFIPAETTVTAVNGTEITLSNPAEGPATGTATRTVKIFEKRMTGVTGTTIHVGDELTGTGLAPETLVTSVVAGTLATNKATSAAYSSGELSFEVLEPTSELPFDATAEELHSALGSLPAFSPEDFSVTEGPGGDAAHPFLVAFGGRLADQNVEEVVVDAGSLTGAHAEAHVFTTVPGGDGTGEIELLPVNIGGQATSGVITARLELPAGVVLAGSGSGTEWSCHEVGGSTAICETSSVVGSLSSAQAIRVPVKVESATGSTGLSAQASIAGGGGALATWAAPVVISKASAEPGFQAFWAGAFDEDGQPYTQAGGHPYSAATNFILNTVRAKTGSIVPAGDLKDVHVELPPGFVGNPLITKRCPQSLVAPASGNAPACNFNEYDVGNFEPGVSTFGVAPLHSAIANDVPVYGTAAEFSSIIASPIQNLLGSVRSAEDFGVDINAYNAANVTKIFYVFAALFGQPPAAPGKAFLVNPTGCSQQQEESDRGDAPATHIGMNTWQSAASNPGLIFKTEDPLPLITGCEALTRSWLGEGPEPEKPSFSFQPTTTQGSSGTGATATLHIPQTYLSKIPTPEEKSEGINGNATSDLKKAVVTLPEGLTLNPSSANGLEACSEAQMGLQATGQPSPNPIRFDETPVTCPDGSKLGTFEVDTPLLEKNSEGKGLEGTIYLAAQEENPFHSLIALYLVVESPRFGLTLKLPGEVQPTNGQLTATFDNNPQLPFEDLVLHFRGGGPRSELATPEVCGHFASTGALTPWSAEHGEAASIEGPGFDVGSDCASSMGSRPFSPAFEAGTTGSQAGSYSPLLIKVNRKDGEQELKSLDFTLPKGLTGKLAGIPYCSEAAIKEAEAKSGKAEQGSPSCPAASRIGSVDTSAGVGSQPIHVGGSVYLAGPYRGAPLSSVVITPAVAGPFDLGDVVVRAPLFVNPETAQITAKSDPIPTILKGILLKVRSVSIYVDRSSFTLNPTNCEPMTVTASIGGSNGAMVNPSDPFHVTACKQLKFKPKLQISVKGSTKHAGHPALKAVVTYPKQGAYANIARAQVNLPHSEFIDQSNLDKTCTKPVLLEGKCTKRSIYGRARAWTPLLDKPLEGPVYLVGGYGYKLPALVAELDGQIRVLLIGKVDSGPNHGIRNTFETVPDAPVSRFVLQMKGGKKYSLLENSEDLCRKPQRAIVRLTAQNGRVHQFKPLIANQCGKRHKKKNPTHGKRNKKH